MISEEQAKEIESRLANLEKWIDEQGHRSKSGWVSYPSGSEPENCRVSNDERAQLELRRFMIDKPDRYFLYIDQVKAIATVWTGVELGTVTFGREWTDNFGGRRVPVTIKAVNGLTYHGTYFKSSGDYARVKAAKQ